MSLTPCGGLLCAEEIDACGTYERERMAGTPTPPLAMRPIYLDADGDEGEMTQMMQLQDFIAQLEQEHEQHQQSAQSIGQRLAQLRDFQRLMGPRYEIRVMERAPRLHEWAYEVLKEAGRPLHVKAIAARATVLAGCLVMSRQIVHALSAHRRDHGDASPYRSIARGIYGLKEYT
jgi:hypothetical protein